MDYLLDIKESLIIHCLCTLVSVKVPSVKETYKSIYK